jgi:hypothetical protein
MRFATLNINSVAYVRERTIPTAKLVPTFATWSSVLLEF